MSDDEDLEEKFGDPDPTDFHGQKRELLRKGLEKGTLTWEEIKDALTEEHLTDTELEVFLFTCRNMDIEVEGMPEGD
jgi:hypothetical protein